LPVVRWKTLRLAPPKQYPGKGDGVGFEQPLHLIRGHFKDYRNGDGLGRYHARGIWWWAQHVAGDDERGIIGKDYEIGVLGS